MNEEMRKQIVTKLNEALEVGVDALQDANDEVVLMCEEFLRLKGITSEDETCDEQLDELVSNISFVPGHYK